MNFNKLLYFIAECLLPSFFSQRRFFFQFRSVSISYTARKSIVSQLFRQSAGCVDWTCTTPVWKWLHDPSKVTSKLWQISRNASRFSMNARISQWLYQSHVINTNFVSILVTPEGKMFQVKEKVFLDLFCFPPTLVSLCFTPPGARAIFLHSRCYTTPYNL